MPNNPYTKPHATMTKREALAYWTPASFLRHEAAEAMSIYPPFHELACMVHHNLQSVQEQNAVTPLYASANYRLKSIHTAIMKKHDLQHATWRWIEVFVGGITPLDYRERARLLHKHTAALLVHTKWNLSDLRYGKPVGHPWDQMVGDSEVVAELFSKGACHRPINFAEAFATAQHCAADSVRRIVSEIRREHEISFIGNIASSLIDTATFLKLVALALDGEEIYEMKDQVNLDAWSYAAVCLRHSLRGCY